MLALLHTGRVHVQTFERLARELGTAIPIRHEVQESLLADTLAAGESTPAVRSAIIEAVQGLAHAGAKVIVCTCSTIGGIAEATPLPGGVRAMRIDRPMAERAVASERRILACAALRSTFQPTIALLRQVASDASRPIEVVELLCAGAWSFFEKGDAAGYVREIVAAVETAALPTDVILLAQASMAPAAEQLVHLGLPVLSSPKLGLEAALSLYQTLAAQGQPVSGA